MPRFRTPAVFMLSLVLASSLAWAEPRDAGVLRGGASKAAVFRESFFLHLWSWLPAGWTKAGCVIDPDGQCIATSGVPAGCGIDPGGQCNATSGVPAGCVIDPSGNPCTANP